MEQVRLGDSGLHVSRVCLGMMSYGNDSDRPWGLDEAATEPIVRAAVEGGVTFFDTADVIPWSPLARGMLAGNRGRGGERRTTRAQTDAFGDALYSDADFDVADRLEDALAAAEVALSAEEIARLEEPYVPHAVAVIS